jgi:hypothetical protein
MLLKRVPEMIVVSQNWLSRGESITKKSKVMHLSWWQENLVLNIH